RLETDGTGFGGGVISNVSSFDRPPPGAGLDTVTDAPPGDAIAAAAIAAVNRVADTNVVDLAAPFQRTTEPGTNPEPSTVSVKGPSPAATDAGDRLVTIGTGFDGGVISNVSPLDKPPPGAGFDTMTDALPIAVTSDAGIAAVNRVDDTNVVGRSAPFQSTVEPDTNPV